MSDHQKSMTRIQIPGLKATVFLFLLLGILLSGLPAQEEDEDEVPVFKGAGIHVRLGGGYALLSGGDFGTGIQGMYDWGSHKVVSAGYTLLESNYRPLSSGYELGGDIVYYFAGRLGIGAGGSWARVNKTNTLFYRLGTDPHDFGMTTVPQIDILSFRLGLFYSLPLNRLLTLCLNAGPAYFSADYVYSGNLLMQAYQYAFTQTAKGKTWGIQGGVGLEIRMNVRLSFILEAQGRYAKISGFEGREQLYEVLGGPINAYDRAGTLYYLEEEGYPRLGVFPDAPTEGFNTREAVFDFSSVTFRGGLNFKF